MISQLFPLILVRSSRDTEHPLLPIDAAWLQCWKFWPIGGKPMASC